MTLKVSSRWTAEEAGEWALRRGWLLGCNYVPRSCGNQLEMWQSETWDPDLIHEELEWAANAGLNSLRVYLHDLAYAQDPSGFLARMDDFLGIAERHGIGVMFVLFDSCWHPFPRSGPQRNPELFVHNSTWVQSPGRVILEEGRITETESYIRGVLEHFADDSRVHLWDLWNEPSNDNFGCYGERDLHEKKAPMVLRALQHVVAWAQEVRPSQPLTIAFWARDFAGESPAELLDLQRHASDVLSFHCYRRPEILNKWIDHLEESDRPVICSEYMARPQGSTFENYLPILRRRTMGAYHWGLVRGRSQTIFPWDSWQKAYTAEPDVWFHDLLQPDGTPYKQDELAYLRAIRSECATKWSIGS